MLTSEKSNVVKRRFNIFAANILIVLFVYAGASKLLDRELFAVQLTWYPVANSFPVFYSWFIPISELCVSFTLLIPGLQNTGFLLAISLLSLFTFMLVYMLVFIPDLPCSCGGVIAKLSWPEHIIFNLVFLGIAAGGFYTRAHK